MGAAVADIVHGVFGGRLPATGLQDRLVTPLSAPEPRRARWPARAARPRACARPPTSILVVVVLAACAAVAHRRERLIGAAGVVMLATVLTLAWTVPWYVWWVLPFAALSRRRALKVAAVAVTVGLALGAVPQSTQLIHAFGYYPTRTPVGRADHAEFERLLH